MLHVYSRDRSFETRSLIILLFDGELRVGEEMRNQANRNFDCEKSRPVKSRKNIGSKSRPSDNGKIESSFRSLSISG